MIKSDTVKTHNSVSLNYIPSHGYDNIKHDGSNSNQYSPEKQNTLANHLFYEEENRSKKMVDHGCAMPIISYVLFVLIGVSTTINIIQNVNTNNNNNNQNDNNNNNNNNNENMNGKRGFSPEVDHQFAMHRKWRKGYRYYI